MDGWVPKGGSLPPGASGDGAFERFLTAAIAAIITIMFSWRLLDDMNDAEGTKGDSEQGDVSAASSSRPMNTDIQTRRHAEDLDIDDDVTTAVKTVMNGGPTDGRMYLPIAEREKQSGEDNVEGSLDTQNNTSHTEDGTAYAEHGECFHGNVMLSETDSAGVERFGVDDDAQPREFDPRDFDSDEDLYCCSLLEPILEEDSDDFLSSSDDHELQQRCIADTRGADTGEKPFDSVAQQEWETDSDTDTNNARNTPEPKQVEQNDSESDESVQTVVLRSGSASDGSAECSPTHRAWGGNWGGDGQSGHTHSDRSSSTGMFSLFPQPGLQRIMDYTKHTHKPVDTSLAAKTTDKSVYVDDKSGTVEEASKCSDQEQKTGTPQLPDTPPGTPLETVSETIQLTSTDFTLLPAKLQNIFSQDVTVEDAANVSDSHNTDAEMQLEPTETPTSMSTFVLPSSPEISAPVLPAKNSNLAPSAVHSSTDRHHVSVFRDAYLSSGVEETPQVQSIGAQVTFEPTETPTVTSTFVLPSSPEISAPILPAENSDSAPSAVYSSTDASDRAHASVFCDADLSSAVEETPQVCSSVQLAPTAVYVKEVVPDRGSCITHQSTVVSVYQDADMSSGVEETPKGYTFMRCESEASRREQRIFLVDKPYAPDFETFIAGVPFTSEGVDRGDLELLGSDEYSDFVKELSRCDGLEPSFAGITDEDACILSGNLHSPHQSAFPFTIQAPLPAVSSVAHGLADGKHWDAGTGSCSRSNYKEARDNVETPSNAHSKTESSDGLLDTSFDINTVDEREGNVFAFVPEGETIPCPILADPNYTTEFVANAQSETATGDLPSTPFDIESEQVTPKFASVEEGMKVQCPFLGTSGPYDQPSLFDENVPEDSLHDENVPEDSLHDENVPEDQEVETSLLEQSPQVYLPTENALLFNRYCADASSVYDTVPEPVDLVSAASVETSPTTDGSPVEVDVAEPLLVSSKPMMTSEVTVMPPRPKPRRHLSSADSEAASPVPLPRTKKQDPVFEFEEDVGIENQAVPPKSPCGDNSLSSGDTEIPEEDIQQKQTPIVLFEEKRPRSLKEIRRKLAQQRSGTPLRPAISPFVVPDHILTPSRLKILASRRRFFSSDSLNSEGDSFHDQFAAYRTPDSQPKQRRYKPRTRPQSTSSAFSSQEQLEKLHNMLNWSRLSESSLDRPPIDHLHDGCILTPQGRRNILDKTLSIENIHLSLPDHLRRYGSVTSLVETDIDSGETLQTNFFPETNLDAFDVLFQSHQPLQRSASMSDLYAGAGHRVGVESTQSQPPRKTGKDRFMMHRFYKKSKSLCTLETNIDDVGTGTEDNLKRVPSVHELRVTKSLQKLNVPDWFKQSSLSKSSSCLLKYGSNSTMNSFSFSPSLVSSPCASTAPPATNVVIKTRVVPPSTTRSLRSPSLLASHGSSAERKAPATPVKLPSEKFREKEKQKGLMPIPIVPFAQIRAMFEKKGTKSEHRADITGKGKVAVTVPVISVTQEDVQEESQTVAPSQKSSHDMSRNNDLPEALTLEPVKRHTEEAQQKISTTNAQILKSKIHVSPPASPTAAADTKSVFPASVGAPANGRREAPETVSVKHAREYYHASDTKPSVGHKDTKLNSPSKSVKSFFGFGKEKRVDTKQEERLNTSVSSDEAVYESEPRRRGVAVLSRSFERGDVDRTSRENAKTSVHIDSSNISSRSAPSATSQDTWASGPAGARPLSSIAETSAVQVHQHSTASAEQQQEDRVSRTTAKPNGSSENGGFRKVQDQRIPWTTLKAKPTETRSLKETTV